MSDLAILLLLPLGSIFAVLFLSSSSWPPHLLKILKAGKASCLSGPRPSSPVAAANAVAIATTSGQKIQDLKNLAEFHETAAVLTDLFHKDGAGHWPPRANHRHETWPAALRPYRDIYAELAPRLASVEASLDDETNRARIADYRARFQALLAERVDLARVKELLESADAGRWDVVPRDVYNAFYCCVATCRHAYRWGAVPVVKLAQLERIVDLPAELVEPWDHLQRHFGCDSQSGNNTSNLVLNFDSDGKYIYQINTGLPEKIQASEEAFSRIFHEIEILGLPIYHDMARAVISFSRNDRATCAIHMSRITNQLRPLLSAYYDRVHDGAISRSHWLSHVQGFFAWGAGDHDAETGEFRKFDGLSGNQVLLFQALDAFLGIEQYLSDEDMRRNVPWRQREVSRVFRKHSFRSKLDQLGDDENDTKILNEISEILKRLRVFRSAHRARAATYLSQPAPERLPMTAGKSLLRSNIEQSLDYLDTFMVRRLAQTV